MNLLAILVILVLLGVSGWLAQSNRRLLAQQSKVVQPQPAATPEQRRLMGFETPGDQQVPVTVRDWEAMRRAVWRSAVGWEIAERQAAEILERCDHVEDCPGAASETEACLQGCRDREIRMSALVILSAARQHAPTDARKPADGPYFAPSREYFSEVLSSLHAAQVENTRLHEELHKAQGVALPHSPKEIA